ncbi:MAG TPA: invasion associated locus B family protein [Roseomonas sp.]|jgi:hypothetical protein
MRVRTTCLVLAGLALIATLPVIAQTANGPRRLGEFQRWTAATMTEHGQKICYAFTNAARTQPARQNVLLLVTHRLGSRNQVAIRAGYRYPERAAVRLRVGTSDFPFYTQADSAFARNGGAVVAAFRHGRDAQAEGPQANRRGIARDSFPLAGFSAAYDAISRECPAAGGQRRGRS